MATFTFPVLGMYTDHKTPVSVCDDFGNLVLQTVTNWNWIYQSHFLEVA
ncbi:hypothetical protein RBA41_31280 [Massilia sp. CCM 9210]|nr:hypothetical protein [Massilia sp. CCM 9210]MDQ1817793.1 hypothetical protein [Massilia sp. CCM 9210]